MFSIILSLLVFTLALAVKGGWLGKLKNWNRFTEKFEAELKWHLEAINLAWSHKDYGDVVKYGLRLIPVAFGKWFFDGSIISVFIVLLYTGMTLEPVNAVLFTLGWAALLMSMGEEAGAAGDYKGWWGDYYEAVDAAGSPYFTRSYGIKKGIQYGAFAGGIMALAIGSWCPWIAGALFPLIYFCGTSLRTRITGRRDWSWAEPMYGLGFGVAFEAARNGIFLI